MRALRGSRTLPEHPRAAAAGTWQPAQVQGSLGFVPSVVAAARGAPTSCPLEAPGSMRGLRQHPRPGSSGVCMEVTPGAVLRPALGLAPR